MLIVVWGRIYMYVYVRISIHPSAHPFLPYLIRRNDGRPVLVPQHQIALLVVPKPNLGQHLERGRVGRHALLEGFLEHGDAPEFGVLFVVLILCFVMSVSACTYIWYVQATTNSRVRVYKW
jgi:hypothetical protein